MAVVILRNLLPRSLQSAADRLLARSDDAVRCSFCGRNCAEAATDLIVGPSAVICATCALVAHDESTLHLHQVTPDQTALNIMILWDPACLLPASRIGVERDLDDCAASLSCRLLSFSYRCGFGSVPDQLSAQIAVPAAADLDALRLSFIDRFLFDPPSMQAQGRV